MTLSPPPPPPQDALPWVVYRLGDYKGSCLPRPHLVCTHTHAVVQNKNEMQGVFLSEAHLLASFNDSEEFLGVSVTSVP